MKLLLFFLSLIAVASAHSQWFDFISPNQLVKCGTYGIVKCKEVGSNMKVGGYITFLIDFSNSSYQWKSLFNQDSNFNKSAVCKMKNGNQIMYQKIVHVNCVYKEPRHIFLTS